MQLDNWRNQPQIGFKNILFQKIKTPFQSGKDQHKFELNSCRNPVEIWQKSGDCEKEIVRENLVEAIPEVGGAKSSQSGDNSVNKLCSKEKFCGNTAESPTAKRELQLASERVLYGQEDSVNLRNTEKYS